MLIVNRGKGYIGIDGENHKVVAPSAIFINSNQRYDLFARMPMEICSIMFHSDELEPFSFSLIDIQNEKRTILLKGDEDDVAACLDTIMAEHAKARREEAQGYSNETIVSRVKGYLKDNYKEKIDLRTLAGTFGYSYDRFRHIFKESTGTTLNKYLLDYRFEESKKLLIESDFYVKQIAQVTGFNSPVYFNNFFKGRYGITPHCYRDILRSNEEQNTIPLLPHGDFCPEN
ncbi:MAG: AraC family transcriptional regulator [Bacilli bacterium]